ncbi:MAG: ATP-binding protein [Spirochaetota bacterium]
MLGTPHPSQESIATLTTAEYCPECNQPCQHGQQCRYCADAAEAKAQDKLNRESSAIEEKRQEQERLGGLRPYLKFTFQGFRGTQGNGHALCACKAFNPNESNIFLHGPAGTGKTHLATAAVRGHNGVVYSAMEMFCAIRQAVMESPAMEEEMIEDISLEPVIVVDDLGTEKDSEFVVSVLLRIIDRRWRDMRNGLIITSNLNPTDLGMKLGDDRIMSRLAGMCKFFSLAGEADGRLGGRG